MSPGKYTCFYCGSSACIRKGRRKLVQKFFCKTCRKYQQDSYSNCRYDVRDENEVTRFHNEGNGISSISRLLHIPKTSVQRLMERKAAKLSFHIPQEDNQVYLVDELQTFVGNNNDSCRSYVISAMNKSTGEIIESIVGKRRQEVIRPLMDHLLTLSPKKIYTDGWSGYPGIVPKELHRTFAYLINRLERFHFTLRQRVKRLSRQTMSYSKSERMLDVSVKLFCCN